MAHMDIFRGDPFNTVSLTAAIERQPHIPQLLGSLPGLFDPVPVRTQSVSVEERQGKLHIIQTSERGAPPEVDEKEKRNIRDFRTSRIAKKARLHAHEVDSIREFGTETELMQVMKEIARLFDGPTGLRRQCELTWEHMRLGAVQGIVVDADSSIIINWYDEWGISQAAIIDFELDDATTDVRGKCHQVLRAMQRAAKGAWIENVTECHALVGDTFYDLLIAHPLVRDTFLHWEAAADLRTSKAFRAFEFGGIVWHNYRGTDDYDKTKTKGTARIGIDPDSAKFFPVNAPGVFQTAFSPAETFDWVNTPGKDLYGMIIPDKDRNAYVDVEAYSYPLMICTTPAMLQRAKKF